MCIWPSLIGLSLTESGLLIFDIKSAMTISFLLFLGGLALKVYIVPKVGQPSRNLLMFYNYCIHELTLKDWSIAFPLESGGRRFILEILYATIKSCQWLLLDKASDQNCNLRIISDMKCDWHSVKKIKLHLQNNGNISILHSICDSQLVMADWKTKKNTNLCDTEPVTSYAIVNFLHSI